jgi:hypothetical protein
MSSAVQKISSHSAAPNGANNNLFIVGPRGRHRDRRRRVSAERRRDVPRRIARWISSDPNAVVQGERLGHQQGLETASPSISTTVARSRRAPWTSWSSAAELSRKRGVSSAEFSSQEPASSTLTLVQPAILWKSPPGRRPGGLILLAFCKTCQNAPS